MKIKYMGSADEKRYSPTEQFNGQLPEPLGRWLKWTWDNRHIIDTDLEEYKDVFVEVWQLILEEPDMQDITEDKVIPLNQAQKLWRSLRSPGEGEPYRHPYQYE